MANAVVDNEYYNWLLKKIGYGCVDYDIQLETLFYTTFTWDVANDDNRAEDGIVLRSTFMYEEGWNTLPCSEYDCSVLEMLIALAMRIENDIMWNGEADRTSKWFWEMFRNLGLDKANDTLEVCDILEKLLLREYDYNGTGGLFPLKNTPDQDQKDVEIWYQAQLYLMENYSF